MSRSHIACWALTVFVSALAASCTADRTDKEIATDRGPLVSQLPASKDSVVPGGREFTQYTRALENLEALVESGRRDIRSMGELTRQAAADPGLYATQIGILEDTRCEWSDDLVLIEGNLPEKPASGGDTLLALIHTNLTRAIQELRQAPFTLSGGRVPAVQEREKRLDAAGEYLRRARRQLEVAQR